MNTLLLIISIQSIISMLNVLEATIIWAVFVITFHANVTNLGQQSESTLHLY